MKSQMPELDERSEPVDASTSAPTIGTTYVVDFSGGRGIRFAQHFTFGGRVIVGGGETSATSVAERIAERIIVFLPTSPAKLDQDVVDRCLQLAATNPHCRICLVGTFAVHFGDRKAEAIETSVRNQFRTIAPGRCNVLRLGNENLKRIGFAAALYPLLASSFRSCFVDDDEIVAAIRDLTDPALPRRERIVSLLGANRPLREVWAERAAESTTGQWLTVIAFVLRLLLVGRAIQWIFRMMVRRRPALQRWQTETLEPRTVAELLALYNPWNRRHTALAGYNTGVTHFGWKYPGRTVVKTTGCANLVRIRDDAVVVDAGVTIKRVVAELGRAGRRLYVVPNYSYVTLGTAFFVPIHGSGSDVSTLGDTIEQALLYDPAGDRILSVRRDEPDFVRTMYAADAGVLVLRLRLRTRPQSRYFMRRYVVESPTADDVWRLFDDRDAANIELRKSSAATAAVQVAKFYTSAVDDDDLLEIPRDSIGRLWDRLEENRVTSAIFHGLVRRYAFHVELFLDRAEFAVFWEAHPALPLRKLQLRFVRRDGLPHSPFGRRDCVSVDLFMPRSVSSVFLNFMKEKLPHAGFNRGKHSM